MTLTEKLIHQDEAVCKQAMEELNSLNLKGSTVMKIIVKAGYYRRCCNNPKLTKTKAYKSRSQVMFDIDNMIREVTYAVHSHQQHPEPDPSRTYI